MQRGEYMFGIGVQELLLILVILIVFTGGKKIPELSKGIAQSIKELRRGFEEDVSGGKTSKIAKKSKKGDA